MTNTNFNLERIYKKNEEEINRVEHSRDRKRDKERGKYLRAKARQRKRFEREIED